MFNLFEKNISLAESGFFRGFTDWHSHVLPCVDDGAKSLEQSLEILEEYEKAGVSELWLTPHVMEDIPNTVDSLKATFRTLSLAYHGSVKLHLSSENMLDSLFDRRLENGDVIPFGPHRILVETSYFNPPMQMDEKLRKIKSAGFFPVLAHPERYVYMGIDEYRGYKRKGVLFQLNLPSICGFYGDEVKAKAEFLLKEGMYDYTGTDLHRVQLFRDMLQHKLSKKIVGKLI